MRSRTILLLAAVLVTSIALISCGESSKLLSATFKDSAKTARGWVEGCMSGNMRQVKRLTSRGVRQLPEVCTWLDDVADSEPIKVVAIEDRSSLISSGELFVIIQNTASSRRAMLRILLANTEDGPVVSWAYFCNSSDWNCTYSENKSFINLWF
ncbi:MAG: hypothetical protein WA040_19510 [Anaerolineae bacterium]